MADDEKSDDGGFLEDVGEFAGGVQGAITGAAAGSVLGPVGTVAGGIAGHEAGQNVGEAVGGAVEDVGSAVGDWAMDNAGHIADAGMTVATGGAWLGVDAVTGGFSGAQEKLEQQQAAEERQKKADGAKKSLDGGGPAKTSDEPLDDGKMGLEFFEKFLPVYKEWGGNAPDYKGEIVKQYDQLREIDFGAFRDDAQRLEGVQKTLLDQNDSMNQAFQGAKQTWKGSAADSAGSKVGTYTGAGTTVTNETEAVAGAITPAMDGIEKAVREYAKFVLELGKEIKCAGKTPEEAKDEIRKAKGNLNPSDLDEIGIDDIFSGAWSVIKDAAIGFIVGGPVGSVLGHFAGAKEACENIYKGIVEDAKKWLNSSFKPEFESKLNQFKQQSSSTQDTVQQAYDKLMQAAKISDDPFKGMQKDGKDSGEDKSGDKSSDSSGENGSGGGGNGSGGGGGGTGGGGAGDGMPGGPGQPPGGPGEPPGGPDGQPPGGPQPGDQDKVTLGEGKDEVTIGEPDAKGTSQVTVIGEDGKPKTYNVAFGPEGGGPGPGGPGGDGVQSSQVPGGPGPAGDPGPGENGKLITPGPDGKAVIHEGDRTITLERSPEGEIKVSVDNGDGQPPMKQSIDFGNETGPGPGSGEPGPDQPGPDQPGPGPGDPGPGPGGPGPGPGGPGGPGQYGPETGPVYSQSAGGGVGGPVEPPGGGIGGPVDAPAATTSQSAGFTTVGSGGEGTQNSFGSSSGQLHGEAGQDDRTLSGQSQQGDSQSQRGDSGGSTGLGSMRDAQSSQSQGSTEIGSIGEGGGQSSGQSGSGGGGMMGGMGGMGAGQQGGGEQERTNSSPWRTEGQLFDDGIEASQVQFRSVLGEDRER